MPKQLATQKAYARHRGITQQAVNKLVKTGRIPSEHGRIDLEAADKALAPDVSTPGEGMTLAEAIRRKESALARLRELEFEIRSGKYVETEYAAEQLIKLSAVLRAIVLRIPNQATQNVSNAEAKRIIFAAAMRTRDEILHHLAGGTDGSMDVTLCPRCAAKIAKIAGKYKFPAEAFPKGRKEPVSATN